MKSVRDYKGVGGTTPLYIFGTLFLILGLGYIAENFVYSIVFLVLAIIFISLGIMICVLVGRNNKKVHDDLKKQHYRVECWRCRRVVEYTGDYLIKHHRHYDGYLRCPCCNNVISNSKLNMIKYDGQPVNK